MQAHRSHLYQYW